MDSSLRLLILLWLPNLPIKHGFQSRMGHLLAAIIPYTPPPSWRTPSHTWMKLMIFLRLIYLKQMFQKVESIFSGKHCCIITDFIFKRKYYLIR